MYNIIYITYVHFRHFRYKKKCKNDLKTPINELTNLLK